MTTYEFILLRRERKNKPSEADENNTQNASQKRQIVDTHPKEIKITYKSKIIMKIDESANASHDKSSIMPYQQGKKLTIIAMSKSCISSKADSHIGGFEQESKDYNGSQIMDATLLDGMDRAKVARKPVVDNNDA